MMFEGPLNRHHKNGFVLLVTVVVLALITGTSISFIWFMNQQITKAGKRSRETAAFHLAQAGIQRVLAALEAKTQEEIVGRRLGLLGHTEHVRLGALEGQIVVGIEEEPGGAAHVTSEGHVGNVRRVLLVRVYPASPALLYGLYGESIVQFDQGSSTTVLPSQPELAGRVKWSHITAAKQIRFVGPHSSMLNAEAPIPSGYDSGFDPQPHMDIGMLEEAAIALPEGAELTVGRDGQHVDIQQLRAIGIRLARQIQGIRKLPALPTVNGDFYRTLAIANTANEESNRRAGWQTRNKRLQEKRHSFYESEEVADLIRCAAGENRPLVLRGIVYVNGGVDLPPEGRLEIVGGSLVAESTVQINRRGVLMVSQRVGGAMLPGLMVLGDGDLIVGPGARVRVRGLVYVASSVEIGNGSAVDVVGAVLAGGASHAIWNEGGRLVVHYDPRILGTLGVHARPKESPVAWTMSWEDRGR